MARPKDRDEGRTAFLNIRVTPTLKAKLEAEARISGKRLSTECEDRLVASMEASDRKASPGTRELLAAIEQNIFEIEQAIGGNWQTNTAAWAAVREMLFHGPINERRVTDRQLLDDLSANAAERREIEADKKAHLEALKLLGIEARDAPMRTLGDLLTGISSTATNRDDVRKAIERSDLNDDTKARAMTLVDSLEAVEVRSQANDEARAAIIAPIKDGIEAGRQTYVMPKLDWPLEAAYNRLTLEAARLDYAPLPTSHNLPRPTLADHPSA